MTTTPALSLTGIAAELNGLIDSLDDHVGITETGNALVALRDKVLGAGSVAQAPDETATYEQTVARLTASIHLGIIAEDPWDGPSIKEGELSDEQINWLASWLAGDGVIKP